ncbi:MAG TPA: hypothetical protein VH298_04455 [Jatrophihabitans sp.]|jgi:hypothetical protein|nr:hypothetical protein [Jatrophihabitans sp.]
MTDTELEDRLTALFEHRAAIVSTVGPVRFDSTGKGRTRLSPAPFAVAAAIAAVLVTVGGTVVGIRAVHHDGAPPVGKQSTGVTTGAVPTPTSTANRACIATMPQSWQRAITAGNIPLDHPINNVISVNASTGDYLVEQVQPATAGGSGQVTLAVFNGKAGQDVAQLPGNGSTLPLADGSAAVTPDWIGYGLHQRGSNNGYDTAMLFNRRTRQSIVLADRTSAGGQLNSAPILFGGKAYWLEAFYGGQQPSLVKSYDLATGTGASTPVPAAEDLVYYGSGLAVVTRSDQGTALTNFTGTPLAPAAIRAAANPGYASYDGTTLRWWNYLDNLSLPVLYANRPGSSQVSGLPINGDNMTGLTTWPFVEQIIALPTSIFDARTGTRLSVPKGLTIQAVMGEQVLVGTGGTDPFSNRGLSLVSLKDLPPKHC